ncbi:MAG TPA: hypothetical protein VNI01_12015 [Elusimicrobiota bacterium]|nr:hypothetical protein [Elusimicrobiota bacterium]
MTRYDDLGDIPSLADDPGSLAVARRLLRADFSRESAVRGSLRARLLAPETAAPSWAPIARVLVSAAAAAALLLAPLRLGRRDDAHVLPRGERGLPVLPGSIPARPGAVEERLIVTKRVGALIETSAGRRVPTPRGSMILWRLDGVEYALETRRTTLEEIFEKRAL